AVFECRTDDLDALRENETTLELSGGGSSVQVPPSGIVCGTLAAHDQLAVLDIPLEVIPRTSGDRQCDTQGVFATLLDVVGRVSVGRRLAHIVEHALDVIEAQR